MEIADVVRKLIGAIEPVGETHTDGERLGNLKAMTALVDELLQDINDVSESRACHEYSRKQAGEYAHGFLRHIAKEYWE